MTLESPPFCPHCGEPLSPNVDYCPRCGKDVLAAPAPPGPTPEPTPLLDLEAEVPEEPADPVGGPPSRRRTALVVVAALAAVGLAGTAWALLTGDDEDDYWADRFALPAGVTSEPEEAWTWDAEDDVDAIAVVGSTTYVLTDGTVHALDGDGHETWTREVSGIDYLLSPPGDDDYLLGLSFEGSRVTALDTGDGKERWHADGEFADAQGDRVLVTDGDELRALDARTGGERWTATVDHAGGAGPGAVYATTDDELARLDLRDGSRTWTAELDLDPSESAFEVVTVVDGFVAVTGDDAVQAFDADDGSTLWRAELDPDSDDGFGDSTAAASIDTVAVFGESPGVATIRDRHGKVGTIPADGDVSWVFPVRTTGGDFLVEAEGRVYDERLEQVGTADRRQGLVGVSDDGLYDVNRNGAMRFFDFDASEPAWVLDLDLRASDFAGFSATDHAFVLGLRRSVSLYR